MVVCASLSPRVVYSCSVTDWSGVTEYAVVVRWNSLHLVTSHQTPKTRRNVKGGQGERQCSGEVTAGRNAQVSPSSMLAYALCSNCQLSTFLTPPTINHRPFPTPPPRKPGPGCIPLREVCCASEGKTHGPFEVQGTFDTDMRVSPPPLNPCHLGCRPKTEPRSSARKSPLTVPSIHHAKYAENNNSLSWRRLSLTLTFGDPRATA